MHQTPNLALRNPQTCPLQSAASPVGGSSRRWPCPPLSGHAPRSLAMPPILWQCPPPSSSRGGSAECWGAKQPSLPAHRVESLGKLLLGAWRGQGLQLLVKLHHSPQCHCPRAHHELSRAGGDRGTGRQRPFPELRWGIRSRAERCGGSSKPGQPRALCRHQQGRRRGCIASVMAPSD